MDYYGWTPYVSVAERRRQGRRRDGQAQEEGPSGVAGRASQGRTIAKTFWGKAWCDNLERYSDFANRLPRGRTYVRNGSVIDLQIAPGEVTGAGQRLGALQGHGEGRAGAEGDAGNPICTDCAGAIDSLVELLQGPLLQGRHGAPLPAGRPASSPRPEEIQLRCSCPDWASMCKHVAAVLYGVGARLDASPSCCSPCARWTPPNC